MKKRIANRILCIFIVSAMLLSLSACGQNTSDDNGVNNETSAVDNEGEGTQEADSQMAAENVQDESAQVDIELLSKECLKKYDSFLNNDEPVYFSWFTNSDNAGTPDWEYSPYVKIFKASSAYVMSDFVENVCKGLSEVYGGAVYPQNISHAIIDCGADGVPELALVLGDVEEGFEDFTDVFVIKNIDNKLQVILYKQYGYRSQFSINEYGYYQYGGATGAATWCIEHAYLDGNGNSKFDYGEENNTSVWSFYVADNSEYQGCAEELGIDENIEIEQFYFERYNSDDEYSEFQKSSMWNYYEVNQNYNRIEDNDAIYSEGNPFRTFWDSTDLPLNTAEEIESALKSHRKAIGVTDKILNGKEPEWKELTKEQLKIVYEWRPALPKVTTLERPSWEYFCKDEDASATTKLKLEVENKTPNEIIDENVWFAAMGLEEPDRLCFSDDKYTFKLSGEDSDGLLWYPYLMDIYEADSDSPLYSLDFSKYYKPENIKSGDEAFVEESIHWAQIDDDVLYVSTFHNTYASSAPENGYITALDMKDNFKVLWRSKPLTCNANNFIITDDAIICGYGFTAEDDFVYVLDKNTGIRTSSTKVKTSPEWFCLNGSQLFVRCYDTDYVFNIIN